MSNSPNKEPTADDQENPHLESQFLEPQNPETPQLILDGKDQENPTSDANAAGSLTVVLPFADTEVSVPDSRMMSPANTHKRKKGKKGKGNTKKLQAIEKKLQTLKENLKPVPFSPPSKILDFDRHEKLLRRLGLWDFAHIEFDRDLRVDFIAQLIATYDSKLRASYVNDFRIAVNRADLGRALKLPVKKDKGSAAVVDGMDLDDDPLSEESISFLESFVSIWMLLHEDTWIMPNEVLSWTKAIKDGHPEKVDWAGLFWFMVEKELTQGDQLVDCYYAAHLQQLIKSQREEVLFGEEPEKVEFEVDVKEEDECGNEDSARDGGSIEASNEDNARDGGSIEASNEDNARDGGSIEASNEDNARDGGSIEASNEDNARDGGSIEASNEDNVRDGGSIEASNEDNARDGGSVEASKEDNAADGGSVEASKEDNAADGGSVEASNEDNAADGGSIEARELDGALQGELNVELSLGQDLGQKQEMKDVEMMDVEEVKKEKEKEEEKEEEEKQWLFGERADVNEPLLQRCKMQEAVSLDNDEEKKENYELANDIDDENDNDNDNNDNDDEEEDEGAERHEVEDGFDVMPTDDTLVGDGLTGNLLQTMESSQIAFTSQGQLHEQSSVELLASRDEMHTGGPFFASGSKREIEIEPDVAHHSLSGSNKRLRIDGGWEEKPLDFGSCMEQMQQLMMKARMMYEAKEQNEEQFNINQQIILNELHKRDSVIEHLHKSKCEEIQKRDGDICRLERELFMMGNILDGYRKALKETQKQFSEYRKKFQLPEEPYYKDAGPGGLMLSANEMEKLRLKQEEEARSNCLFLEQKAKEAEEAYAGQFENFVDKVQMLDKRLMGLEDMVKDLRNMSPKSKIPDSEDKISEAPDCPPNE